MIKAFGEQLFRTGFIHGDPHPANGKSGGWAQGGGVNGGWELYGMQEKRGREVQQGDSENWEKGNTLIANPGLKVCQQSQF